MLSEIDHTDLEVARRIVEIQVAAYSVEAELISFDGIPQLTESPEQVQELGSITWLGAFDEGELVGIIAWNEADSIVDIERLAVDPLAARQGHGRRLLRMVPAGTFTTVSTGAKNRPAIGLYESEGFTIAGETEVAPGVRIVHLERLDARNNAETDPLS